MSTLDTHASREIARAAAQAAADKKASDIRILDIGDLLGITDYFVLCSARNERQLRTIAEEVTVRLKQRGAAPRRREGGPETGWMLIDFGAVVVHAFTEEQRSFYDLERLWSDAPLVEFEDAAVGARRPGQAEDAGL